MTGHAIHNAFRDAVLVAAAGDGGSLAAILRSDAPVGAGEREMLALLAEGAFRRKAGKRSQHSPAVRRWAAVFYIERIEAGESSDSILADLREIFGVERSTLLGWVEEIREHETNFPDYAGRYREDIKRTCASGGPV